MAPFPPPRGGMPAVTYNAFFLSAPPTREGGRRTLGAKGARQPHTSKKPENGAARASDRVQLPAPPQNE